MHFIYISLRPNKERNNKIIGITINNNINDKFSYYNIIVQYFKSYNYNYNRVK
jgi:hypothetical protein